MSSSSSNDYDRGYEPSSNNQTGNGSNWFGPSYKEHEVRVGGKTYKETHWSNGQVHRTDDKGNTKPTPNVKTTKRGI